MTPEGLKNSVLQLAFQGKLVEQRPEEGTAEEIYKKIKAKNKRPIKDGKIRNRLSLSAITEDEKPFDIPDSWKFIRFGEVCQLFDGVKLEGPSYPYLEAKYLRGKVEAQYMNSGKFILKGSRAILVDGENSGEVFDIEEDGYIGSTFKILHISSVLFTPYALFYLLFHKADYRNNKKGAAIPHLNKDLFFNMLFSLPPLAEQKRIVAKIEKLLPSVDNYGQAWSKLEDFNKRFPTDLQKSILQMAIQGKLVEQRQEEGTGEELYKQIQIEKQILIKAGKIKKEKSLPAITEDEKPFDIPENWKWVRLPEIGELNRGKSKHRPRNAPELYTHGTMPMIQTGDVARANKYITEWSTMYNDIGVAQSKIWNAGTLCMTIAANIGDVAILSFDACFPDSVVGFNAYEPVLTNEFFLYGLMCYKTIFDAMSRSTAQKNINLEIIAQVAFPLPPLAEQKRIIAKLDEILPLCKRLIK